MATNIEELILRITGDSKSAEDSLRRVGTAWSELGRYLQTNRDQIAGATKGLEGATSGINDLGNALKTIAAGIGLYKVTEALTGIVKSAVQSAAELQNLSLAIQTLSAREYVQAGAAENFEEAMGSAGEMAQDLLGRIRDLSIASPFEYQQIVQTFRLSMALGSTSDQAVALTRSILNVAAGMGLSGEYIQRIALSLGQMTMAGKLSSREIRELAYAGVDLAGILQSEFGKSVEQVNADLEAGRIAMADVSKAFMAYADKNFGSAAQRMSRTFTGLQSSIHDLMFFAGADLVTPILERITAALGQVFDAATNLVRTGVLKQIGQFLGNAAPILAVVAAMGGVAAGVIGITATIGTLSAVVGPVLAPALAMLPTLIPIILALQAVIAALAGAIGLAAMAWQNNWGGIQEAVGRAVAVIGPWLTRIQTLVSAWANIIQVSVSGAWNSLVTRLQPIFSQIAVWIDAINWDALFGKLMDVINVIGEAVNSFFTTLQFIIEGDWESAWANVVPTLENVLAFIVDLFGSFIDNALTWGYNLVVSLANGITSGAGAVYNAVVGVINEAIAPLLEAFSPPREGPLSRIALWGRGAMESFVRAFKTADFGLLSDALAPIEDALQAAVSAGDLSETGFAQLFGNVRTQVAELISIFRQTGTISEESLGKIAQTLGAGGEELAKYLRLTLQYQKAQEDVAKIESEVTEAEKRGFVPAALKAKLDAAKKNAASIKDQVDWQKQYLALQQKGVDIQLRLVKALERLSKTQEAAEKKPAAGGKAEPIGAARAKPTVPSKALYGAGLEKELPETGIGRFSAGFENARQQVAAFIAMPLEAKLSLVAEWLTTITGINFSAAFNQLLTSLPMIKAGLQTAWIAITSVIGSAITTIVGTSWPKLVDAFNRLSQVLGKLGIDWNFIWNALTTIVGVVVAAIAALLVALIAVITGVVNGIATGIQYATATFQLWLGAVKMFVEGFAMAFAGIAEFVKKLLAGDIPGAFNALWIAIQGFWLMIQGWFMSVVLGISTLFAGIIGLVYGFVQGVYQFFVNLFANLGITTSNFEAFFVSVFTNLYAKIAVPLALFITNVTTTFDTFRTNVVNALENAFNGISNAIQSVINWIGQLAARIAAIVLPEWLRPGSPTPFETGLWGIAGAATGVAGALAGGGAGTMDNSLQIVNFSLAEMHRVLLEVIGDLQWVMSCAAGAVGRIGEPLQAAFFMVRDGAAEAGSAVGGVAAGLQEIAAMNNLKVTITITTIHIDIYRTQNEGGGGGSSGGGGTGGGGSSGGGACFLAGSLVRMADGTDKPIEQVVIGDLVASFDVTTNTIVPTPVVGIDVHPASDVTCWIIVNGVMRATPEHPVWANGHWKLVGDLQVGDRLLGLDGKEIEISWLDWIGGSVPVYNLHIGHDLHNYFVEGLLVHNPEQKGYQRGGWTRAGWAYLHNREFVLSRAMQLGAQSIPGGVLSGQALARLIGGGDLMLTTNTTVSQIFEGGLVFPSVSDGRDAEGIRRELGRRALEGAMAGRA